MKRLIPILIIGLLAAASHAQPVLSAYHADDGELIMALDDDGLLYELKQTGWSAVGEPCPTAGPYSLDLRKIAGVEETLFIFVIDGAGRLYQTNGASWVELAAPPPDAAPSCRGTVYEASDTVILALMLDETGAVYITGVEAGWMRLEPDLPTAPPRDVEVYYDIANETLNPFILGDDSMLYGFVDGAWQASTTFNTTGEELGCVELHIDAETGGVLVLAVDDQGRLYDDAETGSLARTEHEPCPGEGPWELELIHIPGGGFDLLCLDSTGGLSLALDGAWTQVTESFVD